MKSFLSRLLYGRHGADELSRAMSAAALIIYLIGLCFFKLPKVKLIFNVLFYIVMILSIVRIFSKNHNARCRENAKYLHIRGEFTRRFNTLRTRIFQRGTYRFFKCPECGVTNRVPKGKGKIKITCPKCGCAFSRKS